MKTNLSLLSIIVVLLFSISSCVPVRHFDDMKSKYSDCNEEREALKNDAKEMKEKLADLESQTAEFTKRINALVIDTIAMGRSLRNMIQQYDKINELNNEIMQKLKQKHMSADEEARKILTEVQKLQASLQAKEDELRKLERDLNIKEKDLDLIQTQLTEKDKAIEEKNARLIELESILSKQDSVVNQLKSKVSTALTGFEGDGLTVDVRNGKVYVSMDEKLLFKSGRWDVDAKGQKAIKEIAKILEQNTDVNVIIEGHTDDVPYRGSGNIEDNWDLSSKRATAIVKLMLANSKIEPSRLMAAGRGEFIPVDNAKTPEARAKNRRTEIILTPKLDELFKIIDTN